VTEIKVGPAIGGRKNYVGRQESIFTRRLTSRSFPSFDMPTVKPYDHSERAVIVSSTLVVLGATGSRKIEAETLRLFALTSSAKVFPVPERYGRYQLSCQRLHPRFAPLRQI
jgi:hypothetical protein